MENNQQLTTPAVNLLVPADRFASASRLYGRLHRWRVLLGKYWWLLVLIVPSVVVPVWYLTFSSPPSYESQARMWLTGKLDIREGRLYTEELIDYLATQAELLRSPVVQNRAFTRLTGSTNDIPENLKADRTTHSEVLDQAKSLLKRLSPPTQASTTNREAIAAVPFKVKVAEASKSSTLELRVIGAEPAATRAFLNYLMDEYLRFKREAREKTSERTLASINTQVTELAAELQAQQEKLHGFQSSNNIVFLQEQGNSAGGYLSMLSRRLANLRNELALLRSLEPEQWVEAKTGRAVVPSIDPAADPAVATEMLSNLAAPQLELFKANQQMQLLKARRDELARHLQAQHPKIIKLNEDIQTQEKLVKISHDEAAKQMALRRQAIELEIKSLEIASDEWDAKAIEASRRMADYERIRQDLQRVQATHDRMLGLIQTVDVGRSVEQDNVGILEPASPAAPRHHMARNLAIALTGALGLGFGLLYCFAMFHDDFSSLTEVSNHLSEDVVGQVPDISIRKPKVKFGSEVMEKQRFEFLESFRNLRASLLFMNNGGAKPRTIVITSSVPEEGKSTVALYLAATLAKGNSRVLLVDADMRRGNLHKSLGTPASPGLAELLNRETSSVSPIVRTELENLSFLPAGEAKRNPGELVLSAEWRSFLSVHRDQFDFILVDTPPVLASNDAAALASNVDGALFVVRGSFTSARRARGGLESLRHCHVRVLGLIFNRAISSPYEYHCYQRYEDSYRWEPPANRGVDLVGSAVNGRSGG